MTWIKPAVGGLLCIQLLMSTKCGSKDKETDKDALTSTTSKVPDAVAVDLGINSGLEDSLKSTSSVDSGVVTGSSGTPSAQATASQLPSKPATKQKRVVSKTKKPPSGADKTTDPSGKGTKKPDENKSPDPSGNGTKKPPSDPSGNDTGQPPTKPIVHTPKDEALIRLVESLKKIQDIKAENIYATYVYSENYLEALYYSLKSSTGEREYINNRRPEYNEKEKAVFHLAYDVRDYINKSYSSKDKLEISGNDIWNDMVKRYGALQPDKQLTSNDKDLSSQFLDRYLDIRKAQLISEHIMQSTKDCLINLSTDFMEHYVEWNAYNCHALAAAAIMHQCGFVNEKVERVFMNKTGDPFNTFTDNFTTSPIFKYEHLDKAEKIRHRIHEAYNNQKQKQVMLIWAFGHVSVAVVGKQQCYVFDCGLLKPVFPISQCNMFIWQKMGIVDLYKKLKPLMNVGVYFFTVDC